ncbi:MAG: hypothetical protein JO218_10170, partial [Burkholderiales bacterium]|nr:hypothetical protein [Burkholderiales bacterium]
MNIRLAGLVLVLSGISTGALAYGNADYDYVFNWAEQRLPQFFSPPNQPSKTASVFYYRYYPGTGIYVGVNTATFGAVTDRHAFFLAPNQPLADLGPFSTYANEAMAANGITASANGTVATGKPLVGATVTIKDAKGASRKGTTVADGSYLIDTSGMTSPYLVQAVPASGSGVYSVSADTNAYTTMNVTPLTDLMVRTWYGVQGS